MSTENLQEQLNEIEAARNDIQSTLESKGETVSSDIRTFATAVNNLGNINTVNGIDADENRNAQLDASNINIDDTAETAQTIKAAIEEANTEIAKRLTKTEAKPFINEVTFDNTTFTFIFKNYKGETQTFDLPLESTVKSGRYDSENKALVLVLQSDDEVSIPVNELCDVYTGIDGAKIKVTVNSNNEIEATIKEGTIAKIDLTSELQNEIDAKATTEYVDNVIAELPGQDELEAFGQNISNSLSSKVDKQDLVKEFEGIDIDYSENQIYTATAINQMGDTWGTELNNLKEELEANITDNTTLINDNKTAVDTEITNLKAKDTELEEAIANAGTVKSVNSVSPDEDKNIEISANEMKVVSNNRTTLQGYLSTVASDIAGRYVTDNGDPNTMIGGDTATVRITTHEPTAPTTRKYTTYSIESLGIKDYKDSQRTEGITPITLRSFSNNKGLEVIFNSENIYYDNANSGLEATTFQTAIDELAADINNVSVPEYSIAESTTTEGYAKTYSLTKDGTEVGVKINIPKDLVVNSGTVKEVTTANTPYTGAVVGDKYLDLVLNDSAEDHIYIPVKDLVDVYTGKAGTKVSVSISDANEISADIVSGSIAKTDLASALQTEITNATNKANTNAENITTNTSNINKLTSRVSVVESTASNNADNIDILETRLTNEVNTLNSSITNNANNVSTLGTRMTTAEGNIRTNSTDISTNASDIASLGNRVTTVENKASSNATNLESAFNRIGNAESKITANASNITSVTNRVTAVETKANTNETNISNLTTNKQDKLVSGTNIKTLNGETLLGEGNITIKNIDYVYSWDGQNSSTNPDNIALWQEIINKAKEGTSDILVITHGASSYQHFLFVINEKCLGSTMSTFKSVVSDAGTSYSINSAQETTGVDYYSDKGQVTIQHDANYVVSNVNDVSENTARLDGYLPTNNTKITNWTPTYDYHPATKKYVDDSIDPINELIYDAEPVQGTESHTGTYYFAWDDTNKRYVSNNHAQASTTATSTLTVPSDGADMYNISWTVSSEFGFDKFSLVVNGSTVVTSSYSLQKGEYSVNPGTTVTINYSKDGSGDNLDDQATVQIIPVNKAAKASIGYVMDSVSTLNTKISNIKQAETFDGTVFGGWHMYSDGECLDDYGFDSSIYDKVKVGNIMTYPSSTTSGNSVTTVITSVESGYSYKDEGGRFYYKIFTTGAKTGALEISQDSLGTGKWYKGLELDQTYSGGVACFTAGTKVAVEEGFKNIEDIQVGDMVYSYNMETKQIELKEVDKLVSHETDTIFEILAGTERIETTWSHPFYTTNKGKCLASNLDFGDSLKTLDNRNPRVLDIAKVSKNATVYEIRVKDNYNYFVGDTSVLVFNEKSVIEEK